EAVNANDAAAVIVNGGKIYVNIKMDAQDVEVNGIRLSIEYDPAVLTLLKDESREIATVFGALTGGSNKPAVNEQLVGTKKVVTIYDEAGSIRENVAIGNADLFATLVFQVNPTAYAKKDYVKTALSFYAGYDVAENPYMSQVISKTADGYADNNFSYDEAIEIKVKQLGDYNNDGLVDSKDVSAVADLAVYNFTEKKYDAVLDIDHDGDIDFDDYKYIKLFQVPGSYKTESEFYDVAIYEARLKAEAEAAKKDNVIA
ncbi:MAG: hypothetical protein IJV70_04605, partial [Clostridia bacterium]|nr:hypothetical protein [Clostridia bacterium]